MSELLLGISLGLAAGVSPGPLSALVVTTALQRGVAAGVRVAVAPLLTDLPVVALSVLAVGAFPTRVLPYLAASGGVFVIILGVDTYRRLIGCRSSTGGPTLVTFGEGSSPTS